MVGLKPVAIQVLARYRKALQAKRQLLRLGGGDLAAWNEVLAGAASDLVTLRSRYVHLLRETLRLILLDQDLALPAIHIEYRSSLASGLEGPQKILGELEAATQREKRLRQPIVGPHLDDLLVRWKGHELKQVASAGERKALGLVLLAAHGRVLSEQGREVIHLLDDADTELDPIRVMALWKLFADARQVFVTSNRSHVWEQTEVDYRWCCQDGFLTPE